MKDNKLRVIAAGILSVSLPLLAAICVLVLSLGSAQASVAKPMPLPFNGEYSQNGGPWLPLTEDTVLDALDGEVVLKGTFDIVVSEPAVLSFYRDHIGVSIYINGKLHYQDTLTQIRQMGRKDLFSSMCGAVWTDCYFPSFSPQDEVEIHLCNIHNWGNREAYDRFRQSFCIGPMGATILEDVLAPYGMRYQLTGLVVVVIALMLLGASAAMALLKIPQKKSFYFMAAASLAIGVFAVVDTVNISFLSELVAFNTTLWLLSLMLFVHWLFCAVACNIGGRGGVLAQKAMCCLGVMEILAVGAATMKFVLLYDALGYLWYPFFAVGLLLAALSLRQLWTKEGSRLANCAALVLIAAMLLDCVVPAWKFGTNLLCTKISFLVFFLTYLFLGLRTLAQNQRAAERAKKLEAELEDSRVSIMLSQIQPHFLYNSLTAVIALCDRDPQRAKEAIADFSDYLRGNLDSLGQKRLVPFVRELEHIKTYLRLEQTRFEDLRVEFDVETTLFELPALTVQPLVENAVKHGVGRKVGSSVVKLTVREEEKAFVVEVLDDGVGFDPTGRSDEGRRHVGLANVAHRLERMANATLHVESTPGVGTRATVTIPKKK